MLVRQNQKKNPVETTVSTLRDFVTNDLLYASDVEDIDADDELLGSGMLDSLASAQLMVFIEETDDLAVDRMTEGVWRGAIRTAEEAAPPFEGDFEGERELEMELEMEPEMGSEP